jgi:hypothetical protein
MVAWSTKATVAGAAIELPRVASSTHPSALSTDGVWTERIDELLAIRQLEDDWDGQGSPAPATDVVDGSLILALLLRREGIVAPNGVTQGVTGGIHFDWQPADGRFIELQVTAPGRAVVFIHTPGAPTKRYTLADHPAEVMA